MTNLIVGHSLAYLNLALTWWVRGHIQIEKRKP